jgi:transposase
VVALGAGVRVYLAAGATDRRESFDALATLVQEALAADPFSGHLFVFRNRRGDRIKVLGWDGQGYWLLYKRLEQGRFVWPTAEQAVVTVDTATLTLLLSGVDGGRFSPPRIPRPQLAA